MKKISQGNSLITGIDYEKILTIIKKTKICKSLLTDDEKPTILATAIIAGLERHQEEITAEKICQQCILAHKITG